MTEVDLLAVVIGVVVLGIVGMIVGVYIDGEVRIRKSYPSCNRCGRVVRSEGVSYFDGRNYHFGCERSNG